MSETRRRYSIAYINRDGELITVGTEGDSPEGLAHNLAEWREDAPGRNCFIAYRDIPAWKRLESDV